MTTLQSVEDMIKAEYNLIDAFIALHPKLCVLGAAIVFGVLGHIL